jgi:hypothetical protein
MTTTPRQDNSPPRPASWLTEAYESLRAHAGLSVLVLCYVLIAFAVAAAFGDMSRISVWLYGGLLNTSTLAIGSLFLSARASYIMLIVRPERLIRTLVKDVRSNYLTPKCLFNAASVIVPLEVFNSVFTSMKDMIPLIHPYNWDATLMAVDTVLHFGVPPWQLLQPVLGYPLVTGVINVAYNLWFFVLMGCWLWQVFTDRDQQLRMQFFVAYILCFALLGNLAATWLASVGPCYYGRVVMGPDHYEPLMRYLHQAHKSAPFIWSIGTQDMLWDLYTTHRVTVGSGISAMPSMHVAGATLFALLGWRTNRGLGILLTIYAIIVMIGSVHLGWHYAIDGYFSIVGTIAIWWVVGAVPKRFGAVAPSLNGLPVEVVRSRYARVD